MSDRFLLRSDRVVQAGAGTGKTHALVTQYLHLCAGLTALGRPLEPRQIAAMTFTDKAAGEMMERIRQRATRLLAALGQGPEAAAAAEPDLWRSAEVLGRPLPGPAHWERLLGHLGAAQVGTFHSFAAGLLRRYPAESGVDPDFLLLDEESARALELEVTERVVLAALEGVSGSGGAGAAAEPMAPAEVAALIVEYGFRAGGVGEALIEQLCRVRARRSEEGQGPDGLSAAYDDEAVAAALTRVRNQLAAGLQRLAELADGLANRSATLARELADCATELHAALDEPSAVVAALPRCDQVLAVLPRLRSRPQDELGRRALAEVKAQLRCARRDLEAIHATQLAAPLARTFERLLGAAWRAYDESKARLGVLDFTDLVRRARDLLRDHPAVRAELQARYAAVLVDECQDTNALQAELLRLLCGAPGARDGGPGRLYIVGDRKQSIYEFRGADVATFQTLCDAIVGGGGDEETLAFSRRSRPGVLALVNALFARVFQPPASDFAQGSGAALLAPGPAEDRWPGWLLRWDPARDPLRPLREEGTDEPAAELLVPAPPPQGGPPDPRLADAVGVEAQLLARQLLQLRAEGRRFGDMAVLLWRFTHVERYLLALRQAGVPCYVVKGRGLYEAQELRDLCAALSLLDDPEDTLALVAFLRSPLCGLSDDTLVRLHLAGRLRLEALWRSEAGAGPLELPVEEAERLRNGVGLLASLFARGDRLGPVACLRALCDTTDLGAVLLAGPDGVQRVANLELLLQRAQQFEEGGGGLRAFIRWLRLLCDPSHSGDNRAPQAQIVSEQDDVVRIMTVHQAKGLEFPVIFIPGCAARERVDVGLVSYDREVGLGLSLHRGGERLDTLPALHIQRLRRLRARAEAARLFYVAVTRARDRVFFLGEGRRQRGTWRDHLEALLASPEGGVLATRPLPLGPPPAATAPVERPALPPAAVAMALARAYEPPPPAVPVTLPLAAAIDLALCPRRFHLRHALLLEEEEDPPAGAEEERGPGDRLRLGTLAHCLLGRADLAGRGADLESLLLAEGHDPLQPRAAEVRTRGQRLLRSRFFVEDVARAEVLHRALPFRLPLGPAGALRLTGQLDLVLRDPDGTVTILDYRYGYRPPGDHPREALRRAVLGALGRMLVPQAPRLRVGSCYLREADPAPLLEEPQAPLLLDELARGAWQASLGERRALRLPVLLAERCAALGCGYQLRCHAQEKQSTAEAL